MFNSSNKIDDTLISKITILNNKINQEIIYKTVKKRIEKALNDDEMHPLRARSSITDKKQYYFDDSKSKDLAEKIVNISNHKLTKIELANLLLDSNMSALINIYENKINIVCSHTFFDGIGFANLIGNVLDYQILNHDIIPEIKYNAVLSAVMIIKDLPKILYNIYSTPGSLSIKENKMKPINHQIIFDKLKNIKELKNFLNDKYQGFSFNSTITTILSLFLLDNINKKSLKVGNVLGFKRKKGIFNNTSLIIINLNKSENWDFLTFYEKFISISEQIDTAMKTFVKSQINYFYMLNSEYNIPQYFGKNDKNDNNLNLDLAITGCAVQKSSFNNNPIKINTSYFRPNAPLYISYMTEGDNISFYIHNNSNDITKNKKSTQIKEIIKNIIKEIK